MIVRLQRPVYCDIVGRLTQTEHLHVETHINVNCCIVPGLNKNGVPLRAELVVFILGKYAVNRALNVAVIVGVNMMTFGPKSTVVETLTVRVIVPGVPSAVVAE